MPRLFLFLYLLRKRSLRKPETFAMPNQQDQEWDEAQKIVISTDLTTAAKKHLQFLEVVDKNGHLYDGPALEKAIFRYKYYWLPLLAEYTNLSQLPECQFVVPLDCEWIWHCHRLNPVRYMVDCIELFGKVLDPGCVVVSSVEGACKKQSEEIWSKKYPQERYELNFGDHSIKNDTHSRLPDVPSTNYDLISAVKRQSSFYHKVSGAIYREDLYLEEAVKRYKGFLHLVSRNIKKKLNNPCVPTYDIDLMWHTHQLYPRSYCKDAMALVGQMLHHDDTDTDQSKGGKLDVSIKTTTQQWSEMFGSLYWRVGSRSSDTFMDTEGEHSTAIAARCWCLTEPMVNVKSATRCKCIPAENLVNEKSAARCKCIPAKHMVNEKSAARCMCVPGEHMVNEKAAARCKCIPADHMVNEKSAARCLCIPAEHMVNEKSTARCKCVPAEHMVNEKSAARCKCVPAEHMVNEKSAARCKCIPAEHMVNEKSAARCKCIPAEHMVNEKSAARCKCIPAEHMVNEKSAARCKCIPADMEDKVESSAWTARCWCLTEQMDGQKLIIESIASGAIEV
ncbi:putative Glycine-rich domain-containing protein [Helianthus annuus]|nr:putative Glycine-rich domain-containing protein [Helianthus annuus]